MKIGIITLPLYSNYGGILQAWALQTILERMGHKVEVLQNRKRIGVIFVPLRYVKRLLLKMMGRKCDFFAERLLKFTRRFVNECIHLHRYSSFSKIKQGEFDAFVVGSDQIWRPMYLKRMLGKTALSDAFLNFTKDWNVKRISYAASLGTNEWEYTPEETEWCKDRIKKFDAVSIREKGGVDMVNEHWGCGALQVLDPTFLLCADDYRRLFEGGKSVSSLGNMMAYVLDENGRTEAFIAGIAKEKGLKTFKTNAPMGDRSLPISQRIQPPVEQWLRGFEDAEFIVTDSFHACVFSILFRKQFVALGNKKRGMDRFTSLLSLFGLEERLVFSLEDALNLSPIDYDSVYEKYEVMREDSMNFLIQHLAK